MKTIYLDNAATTRPDPRVISEMTEFMTEKYGNPSAVYGFAEESRKAVENARKQTADLIGANPKEIFFTSGGSESDNWAIKSCAEVFSAKGKHIITSKIEHHAVLNTCKYLEKHGFEVTYLDVDENGKISVNQLEKAIRPDTILISIMTANNEIGTIEPVAEIGKIAHEHGVLFHTDAVQAYGHIPINVDEMNIDLLSASGHKFNGPKGTGLLYVRKGVKLISLIHGGAQERNRRAGTLNVAGIVGMGKAAQIAKETLKLRAEQEEKLRDHIIERVLREIPYSRLNGDKTCRLPNNANFCFRFIEGESMLILLDQNGICASSGSACTSGSLDPSHVLLAIGLPHEIAHGSLRLTLSSETTLDDADYTVDTLKKIVQRLRDMSPLYADFTAKQKGA